MDSHTISCNLNVLPTAQRQKRLYQLLQQRAMNRTPGSCTRSRKAKPFLATPAHIKSDILSKKCQHLKEVYKLISTDGELNR